MNYDTKLPPFKWFILENFPYIEEDFDALTNWQLFCKLGKEMNKIIQKCNLTGEQVENLTNAFNELKAYVDNYFENLDVQEEINDKLDEMAESGQLTDIIAQYLQLAGVLAYDTKTAMKSATNLVEGSIAKTLGNSVYSDGKGAFYRVRQVQNTDVIDDNTIIALNDPDLVAEKIPYSSSYELQEQITENSENIENVKDMITEVNLCNNITYDLPTAYADWFTQGIAVYNNVLYVYIEKNDAGKLLAFNYTNYTFIDEYDVNLAHGGDLTIIDNIMYAVKVDGTKNLVAIDLTDYTTTDIAISVDENKLVGVSKIDSDNLFITGANDYGSNFNNVGFYIYNITSGTLQKLTTSSDISINFYAIQSINYKNGYLYYLVSNPDQIIKCKVDLVNNTVKFVGTYKLPEKDNLGLLVGEYEGLDNIPNSQNMILSTHILDDDLTGRTLKTYIINLEHNVPSFPVHYDDIRIIDSISGGDYTVYLNKYKNVNTYLELGTEDYPFKSIARAVNYCKSNKQSRVDISTTNSNFDVYKINTINNADITFNILSNNIEIDLRRILGSKIQFSDEGVSTPNSFIKLIGYIGAPDYGTIVNSNVKFFCNLHVVETTQIFKSTIEDCSKLSSTIAYGTPIFSVRRLSVFHCNTTWVDDNSNYLYFQIRDGVTLFLNNVKTNAGTWIGSHVGVYGGSTAYTIISAGQHVGS